MEEAGVEATVGVMAVATLRDNIFRNSRTRQKREIVLENRVHGGGGGGYAPYATGGAAAGSGGYGGGASLLFVPVFEFSKTNTIFD